MILYESHKSHKFCKQSTSLQYKKLPDSNQWLFSASFLYLGTDYYQIYE